MRRTEGTRREPSVRAAVAPASDPTPSDPRPSDPRPSNAHVSAAAQALAWLGHPISLVGLAVLILNDHVLKAEFGTWWTGKLSDVAGLVFAPALVAVAASALAPRARPRAIAAASVAAIGIGFAAVKATAAGAAVASAAWTAIAEPVFEAPSVVRRDATDLLALPALALAWWAFTRAGRRPPSPRAVRTVRASVLLPLAALAVLATSVADPKVADDVVVDSGNVAVRTGYVRHPGGFGDRVWYEIPAADLAARRDTWVKADLRRSKELDAASAATGSTALGSCFSDIPNVCFRMVTARIAVETSGDGGETWGEAWSLTDDQQGRKMDYDWYTFPSQWRGPTATVSLDGGHLVVVATGPDGVLMRDIDGTWARLGFPGEPPPPDIPDTPKVPTATVSPWFVGFVDGFVGCFIVLAIGLRGRRTRWYAYLLGVPTLLLGLSMLLGYSAMNVMPEYPESQDSFFALLGTVSLCMGAAFALAGAAVFSGFQRGVWRWVWRASGVVGLITALAWSRVGFSDAGTSFGLGVMLAAIVAAVVWVRRRKDAFGNTIGDASRR